MRKHPAEQIQEIERRPYVVIHVAVSLDGSTTGFEVDVGRFYSLLPTWQ